MIVRLNSQTRIFSKFLFFLRILSRFFNLKIYTILFSFLFYPFDFLKDELSKIIILIINYNYFNFAQITLVSEQSHN